MSSLSIDAIEAALEVSEQTGLPIEEIRSESGKRAEPDTSKSADPIDANAALAEMKAQTYAQSEAGAAGVAEALSALANADPTEAKAKAQSGTGCGVSAIVESERAALTEREHAKRNTCRDAAEWLTEPDEPDNPLIGGLIEVGSLVAVVGPAKAAKSWLAEELAVCLAAGVDFLGRKVKRQRVYYANVEISAKQFKKRLRSMCKRLGIDGERLRGWLFVENMRGHAATWTWCYDEAKRRKAEAVIIDPFYQVFKGCETNEADCQKAVEEMKKFLAAGLTTFIVFHAPKGYSGDRQIVDMISGSSVLVRFPENVIAILPHATDKTARVVDCSVLRDYPPPDPFSVRFDEGALMLASDLPPVLKSGMRAYKTPEEREADKARKQDAEHTKVRNCLKAILDKAGSNLLSVSQVKERLAAQHIGKHKAEDYLRARLDGGELRKCYELTRDANGGARQKPKREGGREFISTPERIEAYLAAFDELPYITSQTSQSSHIGNIGR